MTLRRYEGRNRWRDSLPGHVVNRFLGLGESVALPELTPRLLIQVAWKLREKMLLEARRHFSFKTAGKLQCTLQTLSRTQFTVTSQPVNPSSRQTRGCRAHPFHSSLMTPRSAPSSSINRLNQIQKQFSTTTSKMSGSNNSDFQLSNVFDVKGKVSIHCPNFIKPLADRAEI